MSKPIFITYIPFFDTEDFMKNGAKVLKKELKDEYHLFIIPIELERLKELLNLKEK
jgi:guanylate kinase